MRTLYLLRNIDTYGRIGTFYGRIGNMSESAQIRHMPDGRHHAGLWGRYIADKTLQRANLGVTPQRANAVLPRGAESPDIPLSSNMSTVTGSL